MRRICNILRYVLVIAFNIFIMVVFHSYINFVLLAALICFPVYSIWGFYKVKQELSLDIKVP